MNKQKTETDPEIQRILYGQKGRGRQTDNMGEGEWEVQDSGYSKSHGYKYSIGYTVSGTVISLCSNRK